MKNVEENSKRQKTMSEIRQAEARIEAIRVKEEKDAWDRMIAQERDEEMMVRYSRDLRNKDGRLITRDELNVFIYGGLDINEQNLQGNTYSHLLVIAGDFEGVRLFCDAGSNLELNNKSGKKPIDIALEKFKEFPSENNKNIIDIISRRLIDNRCNKKEVLNRQFPQ